jgi:uncharacterized protein
MFPIRHRLGAAACALIILIANPARADAPEAVRPALWKVADEDTTIWLFGTIHVLPEQVAWDAGRVGKALDSAQELVTEIPMDETAHVQGAILQKALRKDGKALRDTLPAKERATYDAAMAGIGLPPAAFDRNDAWFAALMLTLIPLKNAGYSTESGIDQQVAARARARHIPNAAFETAEYQIGLFDGLPEKTQQTYLAEVLDGLPTVKTDVDAMVSAWKAGDADHLAELMNEDESDPTVRKVLITDRNANWARWLKARLDRPGTVFVAVGAGHLAGPGSVQDQLAAQGIASTRVQ